MALGFQGVILDIDGTLVDSHRFHSRAWSRAFKENYFNVPEEQVRKLIGLGGEQIVPRVLHVSPESPVARRISNLKKRIFMSEYLPSLKVFTMSRALVMRLKRFGYKVVVGTACDPDEAAALLMKAQVDDLVTLPGALARANTSHVVAAALQELGLPPYKVVMLGDTPYDIEAASRSGVSAIGLRCGGWDDSALERAIALYDDPEDLWLRFHSSPLGHHTKVSHKEVS